MSPKDVEHDLEIALANLKILRDEVGRGEQGRHYSVAVTELENVLLRVRFGERLPK